ncbi:aspartyl protease family protein [Chryseosolibacter indicus]|uniref:Aspartyl protease family protein n=1 Tax=Chryseosolibacter indicus TaxID=2782351 RepID=A0ABS5VWP3_9BACT|nr:aspartyl protease family protein [Chryseosolibacter indicus]MBT1705299.1 aspartyl protease family protein [Chryseosolibacter indicus]
MKLPRLPIIQFCILFLFYHCSYGGPIVGFALPDSMMKVTLKFRTLSNLIILPVTINDSVKVNLLLDTGCRNLVLFGKKFEKLLSVDKTKEVIFSGLGDGNAVLGHLSLNNRVTIDAVLGRSVPIVVVPQKNLFGKYKDIHGVIGYDIFQKFEIEINSRTQEITFRPAASANAPEDHLKIPLRVDDSKPVITSTISLGGKTVSYDLMIDTGSSIGLLLKTTDVEQFGGFMEKSVIGRGLNGDFMGFSKVVHILTLENFKLKRVLASIVESPSRNEASIGMEILKDYIVILNYCRAYACLKKLDT